MIAFLLVIAIMVLPALVASVLVEDAFNRRRFSCDHKVSGVTCMECWERAKKEQK